MVTGIRDPKVRETDRGGEPIDTVETTDPTPDVQVGGVGTPPTIPAVLEHDEVSHVEPVRLTGAGPTPTDPKVGAWRPESTDRADWRALPADELVARRQFLGKIFGVYDREPTNRLEPGRLVETRSRGDLDAVVGMYHARLAALAAKYPGAFVMPSDDEIRRALAMTQAYAQLERRGAQGKSELDELSARFLADPTSFELMVLPDATSLLTLMAKERVEPPPAGFEPMREAEIRGQALAYVRGLGADDHQSLVSGILRVMDATKGGRQVLSELKSRNIPDDEIAAEFMARTRFERSRGATEQLQRLEAPRLAMARRNTLEPAPAPAPATPEPTAPELTPMVRPVGSRTMSDSLEDFGITERDLREIARRDMTAIRATLIEVADTRDAAAAPVDAKDAEASHGVPAQTAAAEEQRARAAAALRRDEALLEENRVTARKVDEKVAEADAQVRRQVAQAAVDRNLEERDARNADHDKPRRPAPRAGRPR